MDAETLRFTVILDAADAGTAKVHQGLAEGNVDLILYQPGEIDLNVAVSGEAFMVIAETWNSYWTASING